MTLSKLSSQKCWVSSKRFGKPSQWASSLALPRSPNRGPSTVAPLTAIGRQNTSAPTEARYQSWEVCLGAEGCQRNGRSLTPNGKKLASDVGPKNTPHQPTTPTGATSRNLSKTKPIGLKWIGAQTKLQPAVLDMLTATAVLAPPRSRHIQKETGVIGGRSGQVLA